MTLFIHIGFGKTGTTAIQDFLFANRNQLLENRLIYPETGLEGSGHHGLSPLGCQSLSDDLQKAYRFLCDQLNANSQSSMLLSSENYSFMHKDCIRHLGNLFAKQNVNIIFYVRSQPRLIESTYLQWQKVGVDYLGSIDRFFQVHQEAFDFMVRIEPWIEAFGEDSIRVRLYDERIIGKDVRVDFLRLIGIGEEVEVGAYDSRNSSLLLEFSKLVNCFDALSPVTEVREHFINELLDISNKLKPATYGSLISDSLRAKIIETYKVSNLRFANRFLNNEEGRLL